MLDPTPLFDVGSESLNIGVINIQIMAEVPQIMVRPSDTISDKPYVNVKTLQSSQNAASGALLKRNINLICSHTFLLTLYQSICNWNVFDAYLSLLAKANGYSNPNTWVGFAESLTGLATMICAIPFGILADKCDRTRIMRLTGILGILASSLSFLAFFFDSTTLLYSNLLLWGAFTSFVNTSGEAIFADSCKKGSRSEKTTLKGQLQTAGLALGPFILVGMFLFIDTDWTIPQLHVPLLLGCVFGVMCALPLFFLQDPHRATVLESPLLPTSCPESPSTCYSHNARSSRRSSMAFSVNSLVLSGNSRRIRTLSASVRPRLDSRVFHVVEEQESDGADHQKQLFDEEQRFQAMTALQRAVPFFLTTADFITEVGAGMTVRFFPLFFITDYGVSPVCLSLIFGLYPLCVSIAMGWCQKLGSRYGRSQVSFVCQIIGIGLLYSMVHIQNFYLIVVVFILRCAFQNAAYPVDRSILYDYIPSSQRGRWASVASLCTMTWSGSAVIGGFLADMKDYRYTFLITAFIYLVGLVVYSPLVFLVPRKEGEV